MRLDASRIGETKNKTLYDLNKRCLNIFWGKWAEKQDQRQTKLTHEPSTFYRFLADNGLKDKKFALVNEDTLMLHWREKDFGVGGSRKGSVVHAVFTTSLARVHLYRTLVKPLGERVMYCDTDSCVLVAGDGLEDPPTGNFLGDLTDELDGSGEEVIGEWVCGGPKNYGYSS